MGNETKRTPLHGWHVANGANLADFGGYEMPLWYSSAKNEHLAVINAAGLFDTSHMALVKVTGAGALELLQLCFSNDLNACIGPQKKPLFPGKCVYGAFLNPRGEVIDDSIIYMLAPEYYLAVVNAGMGGEIARHLTDHQEGRQVEIADLTDRVGKLDVQGPAAAKIMAKVLADPGAVFEKMPYFSFKGDFDSTSPLADAVRLSDGTPILLSRTGYTGEFGFEIFLAADQLVSLWEKLLAAGDEFGLTPCGLAARDSLRAGAVLPLSHQDIGPWPFINHPWPFALPFNADQTGFSKTFIGHEALLEVPQPQYTYAFVGSDMRKVSTADPAVVLDAAGNEIGRVLTCATDMAIGRQGGQILSIASPDKPEGFKARGLSCGFVIVDTRLAPGQEIELKDKRRKIKVVLTEDIRPARTARRPMPEMR